MTMILNRAIPSGVHAVQAAITHITVPADVMCSLESAELRKNKDYSIPGFP